jgi:hypothetical protein
MSRSDLLEDGRTIAAVLASPARGFDRVAGSRRFLSALFLATAVALVFAAVAAPRLDYAKAAAAQLEKVPGDMTPHQREEALEQAAKIGKVSIWAGAAVGPAIAMLVTGLMLWLALKVAGAAPTLKASVAVAAHGLLPHFLSPVLLLPALVARAPVDPMAMPQLFPSSFAYFLSARASQVQVALAGSVDVFSIWSLVLLILGMAQVSGASRRRAAITVAVLWFAYVALFKVAPAAAVAAAGLGPKGGA